MAMTRSEREEHWRGLLEQQIASGFSVRTWCARDSVGYASFLYWRRRLGRPAKAAPLTLIRVTEGEAAEGGLWLLVGGARIEVKPGFDAVLLRQVVAALAA
jgi:hypothetical protein